MSQCKSYNLLIGTSTSPVSVQLAVQILRNTLYKVHYTYSEMFIKSLNFIIFGILLNVCQLSEEMGFINHGNKPHVIRRDMSRPLFSHVLNRRCILLFVRIIFMNCY